VVILASPTFGHSSKARLVVIDNRGVLIKTADQVEEQLPARLCEGQITELVKYGEALAGQVLGNSARRAVMNITALGLAKESILAIQDGDDQRPCSAAPGTGLPIRNSCSHGGPQS
jgi:hypothetical protein